MSAPDVPDADHELARRLIVATGARLSGRGDVDGIDQLERDLTARAAGGGAAGPGVTLAHPSSASRRLAARLPEPVRRVLRRVRSWLRDRRRPEAPRS